MIEKDDDRNAERIMRTEILDRSRISVRIKSLPHRRPSDLLGQFTEEEKEDEEIQKLFALDFDGTIWGGGGGTFKML